MAMERIEDLLADLNVVEIQDHAHDYTLVSWLTAFKNELRSSIDALAKKSRVIWHPYPKEKPDVPTVALAPWGEYYTTTRFLVTRRDMFTDTITTSLYFNEEFMENDVIAWAEMPEPYKEVDE